MPHHAVTKFLSETTILAFEAWLATIGTNHDNSVVLYATTTSDEMMIVSWQEVVGMCESKKSTPTASWSDVIHSRYKIQLPLRNNGRVLVVKGERNLIRLF